MLIAIDYDETFTEDPDFWRGVIELGRSRGHRFICVTGRSSPPDPTREPPIPILVLCSPGELKAVTARRAGYHVDVWVDDMPGLIKGSQALIWDEDRDDLYNDVIARIKFGKLTRAEEFAELRRLHAKESDDEPA